MREIAIELAASENGLNRLLTAACNDLRRCCPTRIHVMTSRRERRKQYRHVVVGLHALLDGVPAPIIDISTTAVRLLKPQDFVSRQCRYDIVFVVVGSPPRRPLAYRVSGELTRSTEFELVYHYAPPIRNWERVLRENDSFLQTALQPL